MRFPLACCTLLLMCWTTNVALAQWCEVTEAARAAEGRSVGGGPGIPPSWAVGHGVTAPILKKFVSPKYAPEALKAHYGGSVALRVVVGEDGLPLKVEVSRSLGFGLDQAASDAVKEWKFAPGEWKGNPVVVHIIVEVFFDRLRASTGACIE